MVLEVKNVTKTFTRRRKGIVVANDDVTFNIQEGEVFGLLGQNGAGKTTLIKQILGLTTTDAGEIRLLGKPVNKSPAWVRTICSVQPQAQVPLGFLTPKQAVTLMGKMRAGESFNPKKVHALFAALDMEEWANKPCETLSGGAQRLTSFCMAIIHPSQLVILDEPTNDVDPVRRQLLWNVIRNLTNNGTSVILVTHNVLEAERAVDRFAIMHEGTFVIEGTPAEIKRSVSNQLQMECNFMQEENEKHIPEWALNAHQDGIRLSFEIDPSDVSSTVDWAKEHVEKERMLDYALSPTTIEDVYIQLTSGKVVHNDCNAHQL